MVISRNEARMKFIESGLRYSDISEGDILILVLLLNRNIKLANKHGQLSVNTMRLSEKIKSKFTANGIMKECFIFLNSHYFTRRECISFWPTEVIHFAGWASDKNLKPITDAFVEWINILQKFERT